MKKSSSSGRKKIHQDVGKLSGDVKVHKTEQRFEADQEFEENVKREKNTDDSSQFSDSSVSDWPVKREFSSPNDGRRQKASNRIRKCNFCSERFETRWMLREHCKDVHLELKCQYPRCNYVGIKQKNLNRHIKTRHELNFPCEHCGTRCSHVGARERHILRTHPDCTFACRECGQRFSNNASRTCHELTLHNHVCTICSKAFVKNQWLRRHKKLEHSTVCEHCGKKCWPRDETKMHICSKRKQRKRVGSKRANKSSSAKRDTVVADHLKRERKDPIEVIDVSD